MILLLEIKFHLFSEFTKKKPTKTRYEPLTDSNMFSNLYWRQIRCWMWRYQCWQNEPNATGLIIYIPLISTLNLIHKATLILPLVQQILTLPVINISNLNRVSCLCIHITPLRICPPELQVETSQTFQILM